MPKMTLLDMTQNILSSMDGEEVNSISDTIESLQVAEVIKETYYELVTNNLIPEHTKLDQLDALGDATRPSHMQFPKLMGRIEWIQYDNRSSTEPTKLNFAEINYITPEEFINLSDSRDSTSSTNTTVTDFGGATLVITNDTNPRHWTSFDDDYVVFDSYDSTIDSTLQKSKTRVLMNVEPGWTLDDTFTPDLDVNLFPLLLSTAKSTAFVNIKQQANPATVQAARRNLVSTQNKRYRDKKLQISPNYGR